MSAIARRVIVTIAALATVASGATGLGGLWLVGRLTGWWLIAHMIVAPLLMLMVAVVGVVWGRAHRLDACTAAGGRPMRAARLRCACFWLFLGSAWLAIAAPLAAMSGWMSYTGQTTAAGVHLWSGIALLVSGAAYLLTRHATP